MEEIWAYAKGYEEYLKVSTKGNLIRLPRTIRHWKGGRSVRKEIAGKTSLTRKRLGYKQIKIIINGRHKSLLVHRIVAGTFLSIVEGKPFVNHIDGNKHNNVVENLEWCTAKENAIHAVVNKLWKPGRKPIPKFGFSNTRSKPITMIEDGVEIITFANAYYASLYINSKSFTHINSVCRGKRKSAYGYQWKYAK